MVRLLSLTGGLREMLALTQWAGEEMAGVFRDAELVLAPGREVAASAGIFLSSRIAAGPGDLVTVLNAGAYGTLNLSNCNGRPKPGILLIRESGEVVSIKHAQKYGDLIKDEIRL